MHRRLPVDNREATSLAQSAINPLEEDAPITADASRMT